MRNILGCFIFLMIMMTSQVFAGSVYYVDGTIGNDANRGTEELLPWQTIQKAANTIVAGDKVIVKAGTYEERVTESTSGSSGNLITYQANSGDTVICRGFTISGHYIIIDGFDIDSNTDNWTTGVGVYISSDYVTVKNCYIYQCPWGGVECTSDSSYCKIQNNEFYYNGQRGVRISGDHHLVENNEISHTVQYHSEGWPGSGADADGILFFGGYHTMRGNYIHDINPNDPEQVDPHIDGFQTYGGANNCTIEKNHIVLPYIEAAWIQLEDADHLTIRNNITDCGYMSASASGSHSNSYITIVNNTILGRLNYYTSGYPNGINVWNTTGSVIKNNITINFKSYQSSDAHHIYLYNNTNLQNDYNCTYNTDGSNCPGAPGAQAHDLWKTDPKFFNFSGGDYHLQSDSPCIDSGTTLPEVTDDFDGNSRPYGAWYDIGAYEYVGENPLLVASCAASPTSGEVPLTVNFTGSATGGTEPYTYSWDFGDSTSSSEQNPSHTYSDSGDYTVTLNVTDSQSNQDSDSLTINANVPTTPLEASCVASPTSGEVPLTVNFTGSATGGTPPYSYSWNFGDGTSSSEQSPTHTYSEVGDYTATLTVTDSQSNQDSDSVIINAYAYATPADETAKKRGCFIATAAYGSPLHPYVKILQDFRDKYLMPIKLGREIVNFYYRYSPRVADLIAKHTALKFAVRINLLPLVIFSYSMVHFGPIISGIILVSIFVLQVFLILFLRRKIIKRSKKVL